MRGGWNHKAQGFVLWSVGIKLPFILVFLYLWNVGYNFYLSFGFVSVSLEYRLNPSIE